MFLQLKNCKKVDLRSFLEQTLGDEIWQIFFPKTYLPKFQIYIFRYLLTYDKKQNIKEVNSSFENIDIFIW
jgi:hypothetical protein